MSIILHITSRTAWQQARETGAYEGDTLHSEGFIHCSTSEQVIPVANSRFHGQTGLVLLCIDTESVHSAIVYENLEGGEILFPHIYGPLNSDAVMQVVDFPSDHTGTFCLPPGIK